MSFEEAQGVVLMESQVFGSGFFLWIEGIWNWDLGIGNCKL